jgi:DNA-binding CsgD family transcriptional regulator
MCQLSAYDQDGVAVAEHYAARAATLGERFGNAEIVAQARFHLAATRYLCAGDDSGDGSWAEMNTARNGVLDVGLIEPATFMAMLMGLFGTLHRDHTRSFAALDQVETCSLDYDIPTYLLVSRGTRAFGLVNGGNWVQAAELATAVLAHPRPPPIARILPLTAQALVAARRGEAQVWPLLDEALGLAEPTGWILGPARAARAETAWLSGDSRRALAEAGAGLHAVAPHTDPWITGELARWLRIAGGEPPPVREPPVYALERAGDWRAAASTWAALGCGYEAALALLAGDAPALVRALETFDSLGARPAAAIAKARLRAQGASYPRGGPRPGTRANPYGLTTRQLETLELVREGLTTPQIAARLHISPKTADHHITAVLTKMDVRSRAEAARKLGR